MNVITNRLRDEAELTATPLQMDLYASVEAGRKLREIANQYNITDRNTYGMFALTAGDVVLKLLPPDELLAVLEKDLPQLDKNVRVGLAHAIEEYAAPALREQTPKGATAQSLQSEIQELEHTVSRLEPLRTMASDMHAYEASDATHQSNQDDLLSKRSGPRWESE